MGMHHKTAYNLRCEAIRRVETLDWQARIYGMPHESILAEQAKIDSLIAKAPAWVKSYVSGYTARVRESWYRQLIWCHIAPNGTRYTMHHNRPAWAEDANPLYAAGRGAELSQWLANHYWPNGRPFGVAQPCCGAAKTQAV